MDKRKHKKDEDNSVSSSDTQDQVIIDMPPAVENAHVVYLPDANLGATQTESSVEYPPSSDQVEGSRRVTFDLDDGPSTSRQSAERRQQSGVPNSLLVSEDLQSKRDIPIREETPKQLHNVLLYCFSRNVDGIEGRQESRPAVFLPIPQYCELGTQTAKVATPPRRFRLDLTTLRTDRNRPPCERAQHTFTISGNNLPPNPPQLRQTICARLGRSIGDCFGAFCLCLQVNKDCVFCLGFFVAFVISCSFLTAFFYRTLSFTASPVRVAASPVSGTPHYELATLRFNGGLYYILNSNQRKIM
ncbi:uncharacterized protein LOC108032555 [Drosophila biarmipes]|uniref:uncharacterized protein LOC108032555 n=1 Tax=Drosophila biarmipes TaxID=125945 RepID=UPI0007E8A3EF|nr:uncharacterized protein LOC108032555 [Drosophila biarmipes]